MMENSNLQSTSESLVEIEPNWCPKGPSAFMTSSETTTAIYVIMAYICISILLVVLVKESITVSDETLT